MNKFLIGIGSAILLVSIGCSIALIADPSTAKTAKERQQAAVREEILDEQTWIDHDIANCINKESPWRCFVAFDKQDREKPVRSGLTRTQRMAALVPAKDVLAFCLEWRKVDCADRMIGKGWPKSDLLAVLNDPTNQVPVEPLAEVSE